MKRIHLVFIFIALMLASVVLYGNTLHGDFVFDDQYYTNWKELRTPESLLTIWLKPLTNESDYSIVETYRPFVVFTMALNFILFGEETTSFHAVNIVLHGVVSYILFYLILRLFNQPGLAVVSALLFMFFPIHTEAVAFIKAREELLGAMFILTSWLLFLRAFDRDRVSVWHLVGSAGLYFLACLSKEFLVIFPISFFFTLWCSKRYTLKNTLRFSIPFLVTGAVYISMWYTSLGGKLPVHNLHSFPVNPIAYATIPVRIWTANAIVYTYIVKTFIPVGLTATYRYNHFPLIESFFAWKSLAGLVLIVSLFGLLYLRRFRTKPMGIGALIFFASYIPFSKFIFTGGEYIAERWMYLPSTGLAIIAGAIFIRFYKRFRILMVLIGLCVLSVYSVVLVQRNTVWRDAEALYSSMTQDAPESVFGHVWLTRYYLVTKKYALAKQHIQKAVEIYPSHHQVQAAYAAVLARDKRYTEAERAIIKAVNLKPETSSYYFWAFILTKMGNYEESNRLLDGFLSSRKDKSDVRFLYAVNFTRLGMLEKSQEYFDWNTTLSEEEKARAIREF